MDRQVQMRSFRNRMFDRDHTRLKEQRILVLKTGLAGVQFHIENEEEQAALDSLQPGTELMLYRDADNEHDEWAIAVHLTEEDMLGYISRFKNETIARLMDAGTKVIAVVDDPAETAAEEKDRRSRRAPTENMAIPVSVYLVE